MNYSKAIFILLSCFLFGCGSSTDSPSAGVLIPLAAGNTWIYETRIYDSSNIETGPPTFDTDRVGLSTVINNETWFFYNHNEGTGFADVSLFRNRYDGLALLIDQSEDEILEFLYPAASGTIYSLLPEGTPENIQIKVASTNESVTCAAGTFSCYKYIQLNNNINPDEQVDQPIFIAPNIGIIKQVTQAQIRDSSGLFKVVGTSVRSLHSFELH